MKEGKPLPPVPKNGSKRPVSAVAKYPIEDAIEAAWNYKWKRNGDGRTSLSNAERVGEMLGMKNDIRSVSAVDLVNKVREPMLFQGRSTGTVNRHLSAISVVFKVAATELGWLKNPPFIPRVQEPTNRMRFFSHEEEKIMLNWCLENNEESFAGFLIFQLDSGCRLGETRNLVWVDFDWSEQCVRLTEERTKTNSPRTVYLTDRAAEVVKDIERRLGDGWAGPFSQTTNRKRLYNRWERMKEDLGYADDDEFVIHVLRHTCASRLVLQGTDLARVRQHMGHKSIATTMRYAHLKDDAMKDEIRRMSESQIGG